MGKRGIFCLVALLITALAVLLIPPLITRGQVERLPGNAPVSRRLLRVWSVGSIGGSDPWLRGQLKAFEQQNPGVATYLRQVPAAECFREGAVLPDVLLYTPGQLTAPEALLTPLTGALNADEALLRCGRYGNLQYGLPLCCGAYVLVVDSAILPHPADTPAPTTLLGRAAPTPSPAGSTSPATFPPDLLAPYENTTACAPGVGMMSLLLLLEVDARPLPPEDFPQASQAAVYQQFLSRKCAAAMLTTGQYVALCEQISLGRAFPVEAVVPDTVITDQVLLGSVLRGASPEAASLLSFLTSRGAQKALTRTQLFTVDGTLRLYASGVQAAVENAFRRSTTCPNAFAPQEDAASAGWQAWQGNSSLSDALLPLL